MSGTSDPRRANRRPGAVAFSDDGIGLRVWKPTTAGGPWRYSHPDPVTGKRVQGRLRGTRDEVRRQVRELCADLEAERTSDWRHVTFSKLAEDYLAWPGHRWQPGVRRGQTQKVGVLVEDTLLGAPSSTLGKLTAAPHLLEDALDQLARRVSPRTGRPYAQSSLHTYRHALSTVLSWGQRRGYIPRELSPMKGVVVPQASPGAKRSVRAVLRSDDADGDGRELITADEVPSRDQALLLAKTWEQRGGGIVNPARRSLAVDLAATSGLRWGEQHALRPTDIIWDDAAPYISVTRKLLIGRNGSVTGYAKPKMNKTRRALLSPHLYDPLRELCAKVERTQGPEGLLFPAPMDPARPYEPDTFGTAMRNFARQAGWPVDEHGLLMWTWHSLRHLAAVWQLTDMGLDVVIVSRSLGHSSVSFTQDRYVGQTSDARERAVEQMRRAQGLT